jgi:hypothetical protein
MKTSVTNCNSHAGTTLSQAGLSKLAAPLFHAPILAPGAELGRQHPLPDEEHAVRTLTKDVRTRIFASRREVRPLRRAPEALHRVPLYPRL